MSAKTHITTSLSFYRANAAGDLLFQVRAGVPVINALEVASCYMAAAKDAAQYAAEAASGDAPDGAWAVFYLVELAHTVLGSVTAAYGKELRSEESGAVQ
jgi:hypothetical protein